MKMRSKNEWMKKTLSALLGLALFFCLPTGNLEGLLTDQSPQEAQERLGTLYFRAANSRWLEREQRPVAFTRSESYEKALVQALIDGPLQSSRLSPLFPQGTQVLSVISEGRQLFVTFNERLMASYPDEAASINQADYRSGEGLVRRELAMASLVNTLTENGEYAQVQVLVRAETTLTGSLRLSSRYYLKDSDSLPDPLTRQEELIMLPGYAAEQVMALWKRRDWTALRERLVQGPADAAAQSAFTQALEASPVILQYTVSPGIPAPDGSYAVASLSLSYQVTGGVEKSIENWPLYLIRSPGAWEVPWDAFVALLEASQ
ncbi:MAG: GerMN domain-containing protein [Clostridiales bacterium]|nr:GerMN domain-containing protein [Clostridiales bacterium]